MSLTSVLFKLARASATGRAVRKGPAAIVKRKARKSAYRSTSKALRKLGL